jgi:hypothetical protein
MDMITCTKIYGYVTNPHYQFDVSWDTPVTAATDTNMAVGVQLQAEVGNCSDVPSIQTRCAAYPYPKK